MKSLGVFAFIAASALSTMSAFADQAPSSAPLRHLVYSFTYNVGTTDSIHSSGISGDGPASGVSDYRGGTNDKGTLSIDVMQVANDGGLVVKISEQARETRSAEPALCAVYGVTGSVICDPNAKVNDEEMALLRILGRDFVDPTQFDAKRHWQRGQSGGNITETADYTAGTLDTSGIMPITMQRVTQVSGAQGYKETTNGTINYNIALSIPTHLTQDAIVRQEQGMGNSHRQETKLDISLVSDSMATAKQ